MCYGTSDDVMHYRFVVDNAMLVDLYGYGDGSSSSSGLSLGDILAITLGFSPFIVMFVMSVVLRRRHFAGSEGGDNGNDDDGYDVHVEDYTMMIIRMLRQKVARGSHRVYVCCKQFINRKSHKFLWWMILILMKISMIVKSYGLGLIVANLLVAHR